MSDPDQRKQLEDKHLLGLGRTEDIANGVVYLVSDASRLDYRAEHHHRWWLYGAVSSRYGKLPTLSSSRTHMY